MSQNLTYGTVTGRFVIGVTDGPDDDLDPDVIPAQGSVVFTPRTPYSPYVTDDPYTLVRAPIRAVLDAEGYLCTPVEFGPPERGVKLFATDDGLVTNWTYSVKYTFGTTHGVTPQIPDHDISVPTNSTVDLSSQVRVPSSPGIGIPQMEASVLRAESLAKDLNEGFDEVRALASSVRDDADSGVFKGDKGDPGNAQVRVDTSVGKRVFISDGTAEHMISGDTGWRKVTVNPQEDSIVASGTYYIRRVGDSVTMRVEDLMLLPGRGAGYILTGIQQLPYGFRGEPSDRVISGIGLANNAVNGQMISVFGDRVYWCFTMSANGNSIDHPTTGLAGSISWTTSNAWPTTLPGTPL